MKLRALPQMICLIALGTTALLRAADPPTLDPVAELAAKLNRGETKLEFQPGRGYLPGLLKQLDIHSDSQVLVFSKTSFQAAIISPKSPRALFFNDKVSVGSVQNGDVLELISMTPQDGLVFYTLDTKQTEKPRFERRTEVCGSCHNPLNFGFAGMMVTSTFPDANGMPYSAGRFFPPVDHRTPFEERWGGWYVTGTHGKQIHRGNAIAPDPSRPADLETVGTQNLTDLSKKVNLTNYLTPASDIVALMTLEHQSTMTNYLVRINLTMRDVFRDGSTVGSREKRIDALADEIAAYMLFSGEMPIREPIQGNTTFTKTFAERGPRDSKGRSLRDFDLTGRMFKYPLSYMIYSDAFENMPRPVREKIYRRLYDVLAGNSASPKFTHLSATDRQAILEIVRETKTNLPEYWTKAN